MTLEDKQIKIDLISKDFHFEPQDILLNQNCFYTDILLEANEQKTKQRQDS